MYITLLTDYKYVDRGDTKYGIPFVASLMRAFMST